MIYEAYLPDETDRKSMDIIYNRGVEALKEVRAVSQFIYRCEICNPYGDYTDKQMGRILETFRTWRTLGNPIDKVINEPITQFQLSNPHYCKLCNGYGVTFYVEDNGGPESGPEPELCADYCSCVDDGHCPRCDANLTHNDFHEGPWGELFYTCSQCGWDQENPEVDTPMPRVYETHDYDAEDHSGDYPRNY